MALDFRSIVPAIKAVATGDPEFVEQNENLITAIAASLGVLVVALIAMLMGLG